MSAALEIVGRLGDGEIAVSSSCPGAMHGGCCSVGPGRIRVLAAGLLRRARATGP